LAPGEHTVVGVTDLKFFKKNVTLAHDHSCRARDPGNVSFCPWEKKFHVVVRVFLCLYFPNFLRVYIYIHTSNARWPTSNEMRFTLWEILSRRALKFSGLKRTPFWLRAETTGGVCQTGRPFVWGKREHFGRETKCEMNARLFAAAF